MSHTADVTREFQPWQQAVSRLQGLHIYKRCYAVERLDDELDPLIDSKLGAAFNDQARAAEDVAVPKHPIADAHESLTRVPGGRSLGSRAGKRRFHS